MKLLNIWSLLVVSFSLIAQLDVIQLQKELNIPLNEVCTAIKYLNDLEIECDSSWGVYYDLLPQLINKYNLKIGAEVGVFMGSHCKRILETTQVEKLYGVDPYVNYDDPTNIMMSNNYFELFFHKVIDKLSVFKNRFELVRDFSNHGARLFQDESLDFIFLDANHTYVAVKEDLELWWPKLKVGGIMAGDDYATRHPGVPRAVDEFFMKKGKLVTLDKKQPRFWWIQK